MFRKIVLLLMLGVSSAFSMSVTELQNISKDELGCIKSLGVKRVESIVLYRSTHTLNSLDDLLNIKGIGKAVLKNIREDREKKVCTSFSNGMKKRENKKKKIKAE
jgi:predicted nucleic acid-binding OB-fold protein